MAKYKAKIKVVYEIYFESEKVKRREIEEDAEGVFDTLSSCGIEVNYFQEVEIDSIEEV